VAWKSRPNTGTDAHTVSLVQYSRPIGIRLVSSDSFV
jgi:hypothetical protein